MLDPRLIDDVKGAEGFRLVAYKDSLGIWTCGYGHELFPQTSDWTGYKITQTLAETWLEADLESAAIFAQSLSEWSALNTPARQNAIIELCFNMRKKWLLFVNTRAAIKAQNWFEAHDALLASLWATQVGKLRAD